MASRKILFVAFIVAATLLPLATVVQAKKDATTTETPKAFKINNETWTVHKGEDKRTFYYNTVTQTSTWKDPRVEAASGQDRMVVVLVFALPFLLLLGGGGAYLMYLKIYKPDVLKPKKKSTASKRPTSPVKARSGSPVRLDAAAATAASPENKKEF